MQFRNYNKIDHLAATGDKTLREKVTPLPINPLTYLFFMTYFNAR